jgi:hypothetical protein
MWTTSSSRAELLLVLFLTACAASEAVPPEAPRAGVRAAAVAPKTSAPDSDGPVEVASATLRAGSNAETRVLDVRTEQRLDLDRSAAAVIVLNGQTLKDTIPVDDHHLMATVPVSALRGENTVAVTYLGSEAYSMSRKPATVRMQ